MDWFNFKQVKVYYAVVKTIRKKMHVSPVQTRKLVEKVVSLVPSKYIIGEELKIKGVPCELFIQQDQVANSIMLFIHGGAFAFGSVNSHRGLINYLFDKGNFDIISPNYSLSPDSKYPKALNECLDVYFYIRDKFPEKKIIIAGDSAGGNLATTLTLTLMEREEELPGKVILLSPWLDLRKNSISRKINNDRDSGFDSNDLEEYAKIYCTDDERDLATVSPVLVKNVKGFPKTLIQVANNELLYTDSEILAEKLHENSVKVKFVEKDDLFHSWQLFPDYFSPAKESLNQVIKFVQND